MKLQGLSVFLIFLLLVWMPQFAWSQAPRHMQSFNISALQKGEFLLLSKKPGEALEVFKRIWKKEPHNSYAVRGIVRSYQSLGKLKEAATLLNNYLEQKPQSSSAAYGLGYVYYLQGKFKNSEQILKKAIEWNPKNALALNNWAAVLEAGKQYKEALKKVKEAIRVSPQERMFYRNLQMIYSSSGQPQEFEKEYRVLLAEKNISGAKGYGLVLAQLMRQKSFKFYVDGKINESIHAIQNMLKIYREIDHKPGIVAGLFSLAVLFEEQGKVGLAMEKYREVLKINPQHIQAREKVRSLELKKD